MKFCKSYLGLCIFISIFIFNGIAIGQTLPERELQGGKAIYSNNYIYLSIADKEPSPGILKIDSLGKAQRINLPILAPKNEVVAVRVKGDDLYAIATSSINGPPQMIFSLVKFSLKEFVLEKDGSLNVPPTRLLDQESYHLKHPSIRIEPLENCLFESFISGQFNYDFVVNADNTLTLYMLGARKFQIWKHSGIKDTKWNKITEFETDWNEPFSVLDQGAEATLLTASGDMYKLNGKVAMKLTEQKSKLVGADEKDTDDPIFIENQDSGEHWIVTTKKGADGTIALSKSRSLKAGKIEDAPLPNNIATVLNNALKAKK